MNIEYIADRAVGYGIKGLTVNGNDIVEVYHTFAEAKDYVLAGNGPVLLEMDTFRMAGHYFGDNENYRSRAEVEKWKAKDPILRCEKLLKEDYNIDQEQLDAIKKEETQHVLKASEQAKQDPEPLIEDMLDDLYDPTFEEIEWNAFSKA